MNRRLLLIAGLSLLAGCSTDGPPAFQVSEAAHPELEPVYAAVAGRDALTLQVASNGCTKREDFAFYVERNGPATTVSFARKRLDPCRSFAMGKTELTFTWAELGVASRAPVFLLNPLIAWTGPGS